MVKRTICVLISAGLVVALGCDKRSEQAPTGTVASSQPVTLESPSSDPNALHDIRPIFRPGETLYVEFKQDVASVISEAGAPDVPTWLNRMFGMLMRVESVSDQGTQLAFTLDRVGHTKRSLHITKTFDSDDPGAIDDIGMTDTYTPLLGIDLKLTVDKKNHVVDIKNADAFEARIKESQAKSSPIGLDAARDFAEERLKMVWGEYPLVLYPDHPVKIGDTWANSITETFPIGKVALPHECRLENVTQTAGRKTAVITFRGTMSRLEKDFSKTNVTSYQFTYSGQAVYDFELGQFVHRAQVNHTIYTYPGRSATPGQPPPMQTVNVKAQQTYKILSESQRRAEKELHLRQSKATSAPASGGR